MSLIAYHDLPDASRVWIFGTDRPPDAEESARLLDETRRFLEDWTAHRVDLEAGFDWMHHRFLHVAVDEGTTEASGCSIDALVGRLRELERELDLSLLDTSPVWYRDPTSGGLVRSVDRDRFRELAREGAVDGETVVFDLTVDQLGAVHAGRWELPAAESWHATLLPEESSATSRATQ